MKLTERPQRAPQARPQRDGKPKGDRPQRRDGPPQRQAQGDRRPPQNKGRGGQGGRPQFDNRPKPPPKPAFNNPFAALTDLKVKK